MTKTIMVVDDEEDIRETVAILLEKHNYKVITAFNGDDCLNKLSNQKVDLVLMDIMMPGTPVKEVVQKIKNTKVAYLSVLRVSEADKDNLRKPKNVVGFIEKPFNIGQLVSTVKKIVGK